MASGVVAVLIVYLAINAACLYVLGIDGLAGAKFPATAAVRVVLGGSAEALVGGVLALSLLGALSAIVLIASRVPYAMSGDGLMPRAAARTNVGGTPTTALIASGVVTVFFVATGTFSTVIAIASLFFVLKYCSSFAALFALRWREPNLDRPYRAIGYPVIPALLLLASIGFVVGNFITDRANSTLAAGLLLISYPVYRITRRLPR
jgi:APA family basic amino acid/polyamine antiporter